MSKRQLQVLFLVFVLAFLINHSLIHFFYREVEGEYHQDQENQYDQVEKIDTSLQCIEEFSKMNISAEKLLDIKSYCEKNKLDFSGYLSTYMLENNFSAKQANDDLKKYKKNTYKDNGYKHLYYMIFNDLECFPLDVNKSEDYKRYTYVDSFLAPRTYGGERKHLGTDIMDSKNESGYFPIVSMTDGIVENLGWLELGGYRVGIRSSSGAYFYYAHLSSYAEGLKEGDTIKAGNLLGHMGSTGYGKEGTNNQFDVHLHLGISLNINSEEVWVNPYAILQMYDKNVITEKQ